MSAPNKLTIAKDKYIEQISQKKAEIKDLEAKLDLLAEIENDVGGATTTARPTIQNNGQSYSKMGLTDAAHDALRILTADGVKDITKTKVAKNMMDSGFVPAGKNFLISVDTALRRLVKNPVNKISSSRKGGKRIYHLKDSGDSLL